MYGSPNVRGNSSNGSAAGCMVMTTVRGDSGGGSDGSEGHVPQNTTGLGFLVAGSFVVRNGHRAFHMGTNMNFILKGSEFFFALVDF